MIDIKAKLEALYSETTEHEGEHRSSRAAWLADYVFDVTTYDDGESEWFTDIILQAATAISNRTTFDYIKDEDHCRNYLIAVNLSFFADRLEWGGSIRGAWWDGEQTFRLVGDDVTIAEADLPAFFEALSMFAAEGVMLG